MRRCADAGTAAGALLALLAVAWLPGQAHAGALRAWLVLGVLPLWTVRSMAGRPGVAWRWLLPWAALVVWDLGAAAVAEHPGAVVDGALTQAGWLAALAVGMRLAGEPSGLPVLARFGAVAGALAAVPGLAVEGGAFGNRDLLAGFLVGTLVLTGETLRDPAAPRWRFALWASVLLQVAALVVARSLGAFVGLAVAAWGLAGLRWMRGRPGRARLAVGLVVVPAAACALLLAVPTVWQHVQGRAYLWRLSASVALGAMPWGVGIGSLHGPFLEEQARFLASRDPVVAALWTNAAHAHNELLHVVAEQGLPGLALLFVPIAAALGRRSGDAAWGVLVATVVGGLVGTPFHEPATAWLAFVCAGFLLWRGAPPTPAPAGRIINLVAFAGAVAAVALSTAQLVGDRLLARAAALGSPSLAGWAAQLSLRPERAWQHQADLLLEADPVSAVDIAAGAVARDPSAAGWVLLGRAATAAGDIPRAIEAFRQAVRLHPRLFAGHFNLALAYEAAGDRFSARRHAERARSLRPSDPRLGRLPR